MAATGQLQDLQAEATCSICLEYFEDPVIVDCGHNFCRSCITKYWQGSERHVRCPVCRAMHQGRNLRPNRQLGNMVEIARKMQLSPVKPQDGDLCQKHWETLKLFCEEDETLICVVCSMSLDHRSHTVRPIEEAAQEYTVQLQDSLHSLRKEMDDILTSKLKEEEDCKTMRNKLETDRQKTVAEFEGRHQLLRDQLKTQLSRLEEMDKNITMVKNANITKLSQEMTSLSALITEIEEKCKEPAGELLKDIIDTLNRCNNMIFRKPEKRMKIHNEKEKCVKRLKIQNSREELKKYKVMVTLDSDTAHCRLVFSEDRRHVRNAYRAELSIQDLPDNPRRFTVCPCVLGSQGFTSGSHYWEVQLLEKGDGWFVGIASESVRRKRIILSPEGGVWAVARSSNQYTALTSPPSPLSLRKHPRKLGVYLNYEGGLLSLYNADTLEHLYTFTQASFTQRIFPCFSVYAGAELCLV